MAVAASSRTPAAAKPKQRPQQAFSFERPGPGAPTVTAILAPANHPSKDEAAAGLRMRATSDEGAATDTLDDDETRDFCHTMSTAQDGALDDYASMDVVVATMACCVYTGDFWSGVVPRIVDRLRRRASPTYLEAFVRHISAQLFTQEMLTNYLLFVCHNVPFATKLRFLKMCIDRASDFCTSSVAASAMAAMAALPGEGEEEEEEDEEEGEGAHIDATVQVEHNEIDAEGADDDDDEEEEGELEEGGADGASVVVEPLLRQFMTSASLARGLLNPDRVALLSRSSNKSGDFWRWCIGKMLSSSAQQWQHTLSALSMHR